MNFSLRFATDVECTMIVDCCFLPDKMSTSNMRWRRFLCVKEIEMISMKWNTIYRFERWTFLHFESWTNGFASYQFDTPFYSVIIIEKFLPNNDVFTRMAIADSLVTSSMKPIPFACNGYCVTFRVVSISIWDIPSFNILRNKILFVYIISKMNQTLKSYRRSAIK